MAAGRETRQRLIVELTADNVDQARSAIREAAEDQDRLATALSSVTTQQRQAEAARDRERQQLGILRSEQREREAALRAEGVAQREIRQRTLSYTRAIAAQERAVERATGAAREARRATQAQTGEVRELDQATRRATQALTAYERRVDRVRAAESQRAGLRELGAELGGRFGLALPAGAGGVALAGAGIGLAAGGGFLAFQQTNVLQEQLRELQEGARRSGLGTTEFARQAAVIRRLGIQDVSGFTADIFRDVRENIGLLELESAEGRGARLEAAQRIGLNVGSLAGLGTLEQVELVMRRIASSGLNVSIQQETLAALFGGADERAQEFFNALDRSGQSLEELRIGSQDAAFTNQRQIDQVEELTRLEAELGQEFDNLRLQALGPLLPVMTDVTRALADFASFLSDLADPAGAAERRAEQLRRLRREGQEQQAFALGFLIPEELTGLRPGAQRSDADVARAREIAAIQREQFGSDLVLGVGGGFADSANILLSPFTALIDHFQQHGLAGFGPGFGRVLGRGISDSVGGALGTALGRGVSDQQPAVTNDNRQITNNITVGSAAEAAVIAGGGEAPPLYPAGLGN